MPPPCVKLSGFGIRRRYVGLLGGSFNPAHDGHRHISLAALRLLGLDEVWWLISPQNPLKPTAGMAPLSQRLAYAATIARHPRIRVTAMEMCLGTRYTADTLRELTRRFPRIRFVWLMGADNLTQISAWARWKEIFRRVAIAVFAREPYSLRALAGKAGRRYARARLGGKARRLPFSTPPAWVFLAVRPHPASATKIRTTTDWRESLTTS
ncbi:MAG: nicotinate-nucleotide adenylyltransferase [Alphaproteobacteria bacterium]|nr:nicotinate-nucleotide adenylyltransferase [Alphaproteobacteria bacterium]